MTFSGLLKGTIKDATKFCTKWSSAEVFLHQLPVSVDTVTTKDLTPCIISIQGNPVSFFETLFDFMLGDIAAQPYDNRIILISIFYENMSCLISCLSYFCLFFNLSCMYFV